MNKLISLMLMMFMFTGCAGTYYSHKRITGETKSVSAVTKGSIEEPKVYIDIERCYSGSGECSKILNACECESVK